MNMAKSLLFSFHLLLFFSTVSFIDSATNSSCPLDLSYVQTYPWDRSQCLDPDGKLCCQTLTSLVGIGLALYLRETSMFQLPNETASSSCLSDFQHNLAALSINPSLVAACFPDKYQFVTRPSSCAGIVTTEDWRKLLGPTSALDSDCKNMTGFTQCSSCVEAGYKVNSQLVSIQQNSTKCFYFAILYAAGILNDPKDEATAACILGLPLSTSGSKNSSSNNRVIKIVVALLGALLGVLLACGLIIMYRKWYKKRKRNALHEEFVRSFKDSVLPNSGARWFRESELDQATGGFSQKNLIGQGASGVVYKGTLEDGTLVAVKQITDLDTKGDEEFINEVEIISKIRHRNLLSLRGCCVSSDDEKGKRRFLVYDFMPSGSLGDHISNALTRKQLAWPQRKKIILDVAKGLAYLHYGLKPAIYHRDIKSTNILLDSEMKAKVADFGLAKQSLEGQSHLTTRVAGTYGYLAPEYALYGQLTEKSDVYSFGIVILELMSGRKVLETSNSSFLLITDWAWMLANSGKVDEIFDEFIREEGSRAVMERFVRVGILCAHVMVALRPTIADALKMLEGDIDIPTLPERPLPLTHESFKASPSRYSFLMTNERSIATSGMTSTISSV
ncbi:putative receptor-like protein kinase [Citrus sinensis]|uniref:Receptor-like protein kinase n=1 Tax=Citrus sinensis TaxID=2711 RepID=A0ACB8KRV0_CITSI|nr:putative receptor-like protein kinase [Citrus sinensis]